MKHRILAVAWDGDAAVLESVARLRPVRTSGAAFDMSDWLDTADMSAVGSVTTVYIGEDAPRMLPLLNSVRPTIILVFHGPLGSHKRRFSSALYEIAGWGHLNDSSSTFVFVSATDCPLSDCYDGAFRDSPQTVSVLTGRTTDPQHTQQFARAVGELEVCLRGITDSGSFAPSVGLGVFLISSDTGEVHLSQRRNAPGLRNIGTIGGNIYKEESIERTLRKRVEDRFVGETGTFRLGPLLSCTNMTRRADNKRHYVDLTFLATISGKPTEIQSPRHRPIDDDGQIWFTIAEVGRWSAAGRLFPPVENAYQALRRMLALHIAACERTVPLMNIQALAEPGMAAIIDAFEDAEISAAIGNRSLRLPRLSGFLFDQPVNP
ncbi:MAG: hypothetical protein WCL10_19160 [Novosphingobium sp.]|jgi:hypothetical protein|uniref:hypothetical protein n=1 Tax=Novosphingobium sp. TaxID=1874826 RepID=UPI003015A7B6